MKKFDTILLNKKIIGRQFKTGYTIYIPTGYYDILSIGDNEILIAINKSGDGMMFSPDTIMVFIVDKDDIMKNSKVVHTH